MKGEITKILSRIDESFSPGNSGDYDLFMQAGEKEFSYCILDCLKNKFLVLESFVCDELIPESLKQIPLLQNDYHMIRFMTVNNRSTLIPELLFEPSEQELYLKFSKNPEVNENARSDRIGHLGIINVYYSNAGLLNSFPGNSLSPEIFHLTTALIESIWANYKNQIHDDHIFVHFRENYFDLLVFDRKQLKYCNSFMIKAPEDLVYYLIFVMEQLDLNPEESEVTLLGAIDKASPGYDLVSKYIRNLHFLSRNDSYSYSYVFDDLPGHYYFPLLNLGLCGS